MKLNVGVRNLNLLFNYVSDLDHVPSHKYPHTSSGTCSTPHKAVFLMSILLELPVPVVERTNLSGLQPPGDAVEVEGVVTHPPGHSALLTGSTRLISLTLDAQVHDVVPADGAVVHHDVPGPQSNCVPLLHLEPLLLLGSHGRASHGHLTVTVNIHCKLNINLL